MCRLTPAGRLASSLIRAASWITPGADRADFRSEWLAEIHDATILIARQPAAARAYERELVRRAAGAFVHAVWLRKQQWSMDMLWQDLKYAARLLAGRPAFTAVATLMVALGIGINTAIFSLVYGVLLKPLPFHDPDRLVQLWETNPLRNWTNATAAPANLLDWRARNRVFEEIAFYPGMDDKTPMLTSPTVTGETADPEPLKGLQVSVNFLRVLGVQPMLGRDFTDAEQVEGAHRVVILSHALWRSRFNGDGTVVGRDILLNTRPYRVIGIMPADFRFPSANVQLWSPFVVGDAFARTRRAHYLRPIARLKPGVRLAQARDDLKRIAAELEREYPETNTQMGADLGPLQEWTIRDVRRALLVLLGAVGMVLLVACANLANLLLARASGRTREFAIRAALGGARWRLVRQLLTESALLALAGGVLGIFVARWTLAAIVTYTPADVPRLDEVALDGRMLLFVGALTVLTALLFGLAPAWHAGQPDVRWLRESVPGASGRGRTRRVLVVAQIAMSATLLICAGLLLSSFERLQSVPPGFNPENVISFDISVPGARYDDDAKANAFFEQLLERLRSVPAVRAAGGSTVIGLEGQGWTGDLFIEKQPEVWGRELRHKEVTSGYFAAMGLPMLNGRDFTAADTGNAQLVVVVNEALVRTYFGQENPLGQRIAFRRPTPGQPPPAWWTIVGVARDEKQNALDEPVAPQVYETHLQNSTLGMTIVVRGHTSATPLIPPLRHELRELDSAVAMSNVRTLDEVVARSVARERFTAWVVGLFAALALTIAAVGVYGVLAYLVGRRMHEIGIRVALGAGRREVMALVFREASVLVAAGLATGVVAGAVAGRAIRGLLFDTAPTDPLTYLAVASLLCVVALLASYIPARRALAVDPIVTLRSE